MQSIKNSKERSKESEIQTEENKKNGLINIKGKLIFQTGGE